MQLVETGIVSHCFKSFNPLFCPCLVVFFIWACVLTYLSVDLVYLFHQIDRNPFNRPKIACALIFTTFFSRRDLTKFTVSPRASHRNSYGSQCWTILSLRPLS